MPRKTPVTPKARSSADERESPVAGIALFSIQSVGYPRQITPTDWGNAPCSSRRAQLASFGMGQLIENKAPKTLRADPFLAPKVLL